MRKSAAVEIAMTNDAAALFLDLRQPLLRYLVCMGLNRDEAQDIVQETFLRLQRHTPTGEAMEQMRSWLFRVAHNEALNRRQKYERRFGSPLEGVEALAGPGTPELAFIEKERRAMVARAVGRLAQVERECLLLRSEGLRYREIAEVLGMGRSTVADTVARAIRKLTEECDV
ncbi:MAG TPA: sigma-70 family RNA polymerase sigma factor [Candidatus Limnocylindrales bacterium]|nr:sigma-70 family RNA polymerase sigma factor [Candidatus Limnocylindrales bacterium]